MESGKRFYSMLITYLLYCTEIFKWSNWKAYVFMKVSNLPLSALICSKFVILTGDCAVPKWRVKPGKQQINQRGSFPSNPISPANPKNNPSQKPEQNQSNDFLDAATATDPPTAPNEPINWRNRLFVFYVK